MSVNIHKFPLKPEPEVNVHISVATSKNRVYVTGYSAGHTSEEMVGASWSLQQ